MTRNVAIPEGLHNDAKAFVKREGRNLQWLVTLAVREWLDRQETGTRANVKKLTRKKAGAL